MCRARLYTNYHTSEEKDHKHGKRSHIYIVQGEKMVFIRILQQNIMIVIKHTRTHTENNGGLISKIIIFKSNTSQIVAKFKAEATYNDNRTLSLKHQCRSYCLS